MKKLLLSAACLLVLVVNVNAQTKFRFGLSFSPQLCWTKPHDNSTSKGKMGAGFNYGLLLDLNTGNNFTIGTGLQISQGKYAYSYNTTATFQTNDSLVPYYFNPGTAVSLHIQYIDLPITLKLKTNALAGDKLILFGHFGGNVGVKISSKADISGVKTSWAITGLPKPVNFSKEKFTTELFPINLGLLVGAGAEYKLTESTSAIVGLYFNNGFTDLTNDKKVVVTNGLGTLGDRFTVAGNNILLRFGVMF